MNASDQLLQDCVDALPRDVLEIIWKIVRVRWWKSVIKQMIIFRASVLPELRNATTDLLMHEVHWFKWRGIMRARSTVASSEPRWLRAEHSVVSWSLMIKGRNKRKATDEACIDRHFVKKYMH
jgi:hypothetical protein